MLVKIVLLASVLGVSFAQHYVAPHHVYKNILSSGPYYAHHTPPIDPYSKYAFGYSVADPYTGVHNRQEEKNGAHIKGQYQVVEHDGSLRTVSYAADPVHGFQAVVDKGPLPVRDLQKFGKVF
ncbi:Cuticle protein 19.8 [Orchesella cincta]|uniref:Cuticle protein 19.8 n=1 Tax=Orchesella cincta TaxID=48709 RepID=A0A1D2NHR3_ORCCI|nr:Cuticle protein 19.8 [Orchesella cincta]